MRLHKSEANTEVSFAFVHLDYIHRFAQQTNHPSNWLARIVFSLSLLLSSFVHTNELSREFVLVQWFLVVRQQISDRNAERQSFFVSRLLPLLGPCTWFSFLLFLRCSSCLFVWFCSSIAMAFVYRLSVCIVHVRVEICLVINKHKCARRYSLLLLEFCLIFSLSDHRGSNESEVMELNSHRLTFYTQF